MKRDLARISPFIQLSFLLSHLSLQIVDMIEVSTSFALNSKIPIEVINRTKITLQNGHVQNRESEVSSL